MINMAQIRSFKECCKTYIILTISFKRPPDGLTYAKTSKCKFIKNNKMCISKNQKLEGEAQYGQDKNAFKATHGDSRAKFVTFFLMSNSWKSLKQHSNSCLRWILRSLKNQTCWKIWSKLPQRHIFKNHYKTLLILIIWGQDGSTFHQNDIFKILWFFIKLSNTSIQQLNSIDPTFKHIDPTIKLNRSDI